MRVYIFIMLNLVMVIIIGTAGAVVCECIEDYEAGVMSLNMLVLIASMYVVIISTVTTSLILLWSDSRKELR